MFSTESAPMLPGTTAIDIPVIPDTLQLKAFNELFAHLFRTLSSKQAMPAWKVSPSSGTTIAALLDRTFPAIPSIDDIDFKLPTPLITPKTVGYIHALIIDSVTSLHSESAYARALTREATVVKELEALSIANFRLQFRDALTSCYEGVLKVPGAGGIQATVPMKRKLVSVPDDPAADGNGNIDAAPAAAAPPAAPAAPAGAEAGVEAPEAAPAARKRGKGGG
jgi:hypothetical protein